MKIKYTVEGTFCSGQFDNSEDAVKFAVPWSEYEEVKIKKHVIYDDGSSESMLMWEGKPKKSGPILKVKAEIWFIDMESLSYVKDLNGSPRRIWEKFNKDHKAFEVLVTDDVKILAYFIYKADQDGWWNPKNAARLSI